MCEHNKKSKLFCLWAECRHTQSAGCAQCIRIFHNHEGKTELINEEDLIQLLRKYNLPEDLKQSRKGLIVRLYKLLMRIKAEITGRLEELTNDMMSKIKYPYLYHQDALEVYRLLRDKNYYKISPTQLRGFYLKTKDIRRDQFLISQTHYYKEYLREIDEGVTQLTSKMKKIEEVLSYKCSGEMAKLQEEYLKEMKDSSARREPVELKGEKRTEERPKSKGKEMDNSTDSMKVEQISHVYLTPIKSTNQLDVSIDHTPHKSVENICLDDKESKKSDELHSNNKIPNDLLRSFDYANERIKAIPAREASNQKVEKILPGELFHADTILSYDISDLGSSGIKQPPDLLHSSNKRQSNDYSHCSISIKITDVLKKGAEVEQTEPNILGNTKSTIQSMLSGPSLNKFAIQNLSYPQPEMAKERETPRKEKKYKQHILEIIKERQENVKKRLGDLMKYKGDQSKKTKTEELQLNKTIDDKELSKKMSDLLGAKLQPKKERKTSQEIAEEKMPVFKGEEESKNTSFYLSSPKRKNAKKDHEVNNSLSKQIFNKSRDKQEHSALISGTITKEIPLSEANVKVKKEIDVHKPAKEQAISKNDELQGAALFQVGLSRCSKEAKIPFLQKHLAKYENNFTAAECLSYLYLQQGKLKESLNISHKYLEKMIELHVEEKERTNLTINKSAALNLLGRYSETITLIEQKAGKIENDKLHKNVGDAYHNIGVADKAIYHYEKAIRINSKFDEAYYNLSVLLYLQKSYFNAKMNIDKALKISSNEDYRELLAHIEEKIQCSNL